MLSHTQIVYVACGRPPITKLVEPATGRCAMCAGDLDGAGTPTRSFFGPVDRRVVRMEVMRRRPRQRRDGVFRQQVESRADLEGAVRVFFLRKGHKQSTRDWLRENVRKYGVRSGRTVGCLPSREGVEALDVIACRGFAALIGDPPKTAGEWRAVITVYPPEWHRKVKIQRRMETAL